MNKQVQLGVYLKEAKKRFDHYKKLSRSKETWYGWLKTKIDMSDSCARQLTGLATLVEEFPRLKDLQISYTRMRELKPKIEATFLENQEIASYWKNKINP